MSYNTDNETREELGLLDRNNRGDKVLITKITNKTNNNVSFDIRNMYTNDDDELRFTQRGVRLPDKMAVEVVKAILKGMEVDSIAEVITYSEGLNVE